MCTTGNKWNISRKGPGDGPPSPNSHGGKGINGTAAAIESTGAAKACSRRVYFSPHAEVEKFIHDPAGWSKAHGGAAEAAE